VVGVITKIDAHPGWLDIQRDNRRRLRAAGLDDPLIPLLPVSARLGKAGRQRDDEALTVKSGLPQLVDFVCENILNEPGPRSVDWQLALGDGMTELMAQVEHDLRHRLREVVRLAEEKIMKADPVPEWKQFEGWLQGQVEESVRANFGLAHDRSRTLTDQVAAETDGTGRSGSRPVITLPRLPEANPDEALRQVRPLGELDSRKAGMGPAAHQQHARVLRWHPDGGRADQPDRDGAGEPVVHRGRRAAGSVHLLGGTQAPHRAPEGRGKRSRVQLMDDVIFQVGNEFPDLAARDTPEAAGSLHVGGRPAAVTVGTMSL